MQVTARGLTFDVHEGGPADGEPVLLLHGFPQDSREWELVTPRLHAAGLRTYALDQRGYSPGARPAGVADYRLAEIVADAAAVLDALGAGSAHVVGHDWGASVAWHLAGRHPARVRTLTALSVPHPGALDEAVRQGWAQRLKLAYVPLFRRPGLAEQMLGGATLRWMLAPAGKERAAAYAAAMAEPGRLTAALNWYRANGLRDAALGPVRVPTTYVWSTKDVVVRQGAEANARFVEADYRLVVLPGISHWQPEEAPDAVAQAIVARVGVDV